MTNLECRIKALGLLDHILRRMLKGEKIPLLIAVDRARMPEGTPRMKIPGIGFWNDYWNLSIENDGVHVGLSFDGLAHDVVIPYEAILGYRIGAFAVELPPPEEAAAKPSSASSLRAL